MKFSIFAVFVFAVLTSVVSITSGQEIVENSDGEQFLLVPLPLVQRHKRQTTYDIRPGNPNGVRVTVGHQGTIANGGGHRLDGGAFASKQFRPSGPGTVGGNLGYTHTPSGSGLNVRAQHTQGLGTGVGAEGRANLWRNGNSRLDAVGNYDRHFGGPGGTSRPNYYGGVQFNHRF